ncbi:hypothetical protein SAMN04487982_117102 [Streptomyces sp. ok210]|nr:hypothetical protein SAMN04487982_117102 [Streptomyces sp. ok210]
MFDGSRRPERLRLRCHRNHLVAVARTPASCRWCRPPRSRASCCRGRRPRRRDDHSHPDGRTRVDHRPSCSWRHQVGAAERVVVLPAFLRTDLRRDLDRYAEKGPDGLLFVGEKGTPFRRFTSGRRWRRARGLVGMPNSFRFYDLRHTGHTLTTRFGATLKDMMVRAGQSPEKAALIHQHSDLECQREVASGLDVHVLPPARRLWRSLLVRIWCATSELCQTTKEPRADGLGLLHGAGDENRTRALSLGILRRLPAAGAVTRMDTVQCPLASLSGLPLLTVVVRRGWCGGGATWCAFLREGKRLRRPRPTRGVFATGLQHPGVLQPSVIGRPGQVRYRRSGRLLQVTALNGQSDSCDARSGCRGWYRATAPRRPGQGRRRDCARHRRCVGSPVDPLVSAGRANATPARLLTSP